MAPKPTISPQTPGTPAPQVRPPCNGVGLPLPGVSDPLRQQMRRTAQHRSSISPKSEPGPRDGFAMTDPYVRRYWVAAIGPGAVADLLRLAAAAQSGRSLRTPTHLSTLVRYGLVRRSPGSVIVLESVPPLPRDLHDRLKPDIRRQIIADLRRRKAV